MRTDGSALSRCLDVIFMRKTPEHPPNDAYVSFFSRHVVPIYISLQGHRESKQYLISSFVMSVYDEWFLITAGHCIEDVENALNHGYIIERCRLIDCMGAGAKHIHPIPYDFNKDTACKLCYDPKYDYGVLILNANTISLLKANGVVPLTEQMWESQPDNSEYFKMVGIPCELSDADEKYAHVTTIVHSVRELSERPQCFEKTDAPTFYGKIELIEPMTTIVGMSGGPIFSFQTNEDGELKYWLHAVQSRWVPSERVIAACLMKPLGTFIKEFMEGKHQGLIENEENES